MEEETEFTKLPVEDRCVHKSWKARVHGYEECTKKFSCIDDEKSPEWNKFLGLIKKFVVDSNVAAQEKGLEAALAYVENAACAGKTVGDVMNGIVNKCVAATKIKTKNNAIQLILMYIEIEKHEAVLEELLKGTEAKNPKIVSACINTLTLSLREFGPKIINPKPLIKKLPAFLEDRDKCVREEGKAMIIEIYRWIGAPIKQQLNTLKPVQLTELEAEFSKLGNERATPNRYLRSQKPKNTVVLETGGGGSGDVDDEDDEIDTAANDIDPYDLIDPVDILSKLPKDFYDKLEAKKWQERKEAMELLENLTKNPKLESGDYGELVRALKKIISKDSNVVVVGLAGKCLAGLANGLKKKFLPYAGVCLTAVLEKFKEKKPNIVAIFREAVDAIFQSQTIDVILEDVIAALENKNPSVKAETAAFISRCFAKTQPAVLNKKLLKAYSTALLKTLNEAEPTVRDNSAEALGTAMKLVGEKSMMPFLTDLDPLKMVKIQECAEKAVILVKTSVAKKVERPTTAPAKVEAPKTVIGGVKKVQRPTTTTTTTKKPVTKKSSGVATAASKKPQAPKIQMERDLSSESVDEIAAETFSSEILSGLGDANWKTRLQSVEQLTDAIKTMESSDVSPQVIVRTIGKKPGFKDTNFQVLKLRLEVVKMLAENYPFSLTTSSYCIMDITEKLADTKNGTLAADTLLSIAEATGFDHVINETVNFAFNQKNPKVQIETLLWLSNAIIEFGCPTNVKGLIENVKKATTATNPSVRSSAITMIGALYVYVGKPLLMFFENEKPALKQQIEQECDKRNDEPQPVPTRGPKSKEQNIKNSNNNNNNNDDDTENDEEVIEKIDIHDIIPRVDISGQITESLLAELNDKNWKIRNEGLQKISTILTETKFIKGNIGELPRALSPRLTDSNTKIAQSALGICEGLATAMGPPIKQHIRVLFPGFVQCLGDSKNWIRAAAISCMNTWGDQCGYKEFFDGEMIGDALKSGSPALRAELWNWLSQKLPGITVKSIPKEELVICLPHLYSNLEDRNSDVRKYAQEAAIGFMTHLSYEFMVRQTEKLKPGSKTVVIAGLDKARPSVPIKPIPSKKNAPIEDNSKTIKTAGAMKASKSVVKTKGTTSKPTSARKKDDDVDTSPLLAINNLKHQRVIDEQKLKVLKWNFTTPREEFVELLKELMNSAGVNKSLIANMFHSDFRYHLKAIESLTEDIPNNSKALVSNLDLILKWLTLRFFDTNPSVLLKGLDYLQTVFNLLIQDNYHMMENEAACFIPYLILKIGDPKDAVRNGVRALFKQIASVYPVSKLFTYVMEGLKSKNARQRTECLDQLGSLIENYGVSVCQPTPSAALREIAKQIADRDNSVRNAALNCIVQAYYLEGERVYKLVGNISEKDLSLLEERIKRAGKNRPIKSASNSRISAVPVTVIAPPVEDDNDDNGGADDDDDDVVADDNEDDDHIVEEPIEIPTERIKTPPKPKISGPFGLDMDFLKQLEENAPARYKMPKLTDINWDPNETVNTINVPQKNIIPISHTRLNTNRVVSPISSPSPTPTNKDDNLERTIIAMASPELHVAIQAMNNMETFLKSQTSQVSLIQLKEDKFMNAINMQLQLLQTYPQNPESPYIAKGFRSVFMVTLAFYESGILGKNVSMPQLKELVHQMLILLAENKLCHFSQADAYSRVVNSITVKTIDHSNHTTIMCVLIKLLHDCAEKKYAPKYEELAMKCLWKIVKTMTNWSDDLDYDTILFEVHQFFKDYPTSWWKKRSTDMPLRTIKTVLHSMTKVKGSSILHHLTKINNTQESELRHYLNRLVETVKPDDNNTGSRTITKQKHISKVIYSQLSEIFNKIGSKNLVQEGLQQLYDFKIQHPEADLQPFLVQSHHLFQNFIEQGLKDIDQARKNQTQQINKQLTIDTNNTVAPLSAAHEERTMMNPLERLEKLRALEAKFHANTPSHSNPT